MVIAESTLSGFIGPGEISDIESLNSIYNKNENFRLSKPLVL